MSKQKSKTTWLDCPLCGVKLEETILHKIFICDLCGTLVAVDISNKTNPSKAKFAKFELSRKSR